MGTAERVARRKTEGLHEATECHGYLRNAQELVADGQTRYERRINSPLDTFIFPIWSVVEKQSSASNLVLKIFLQSSSVAILAQAISCSDVRGVSPVHKRFWFCLVQVSTTQFCGCPLVGAHIVAFSVVLRVLNRVLVAVIVHSICIPNSCIFHIAKTGLLRCCLYTHVNCRATVDHDQNAQLLMLMIQGEDPSARDPLSSSQWAKPRTWCGLSPCRRNTSHFTCLMFLLSPCLCSFLCFSLCLSLWPSLCLSVCLCCYLCLSWARRLPLVWCRSRPLCTIVCTLDASLSAHSWEHHTPAASSRSDQRVFRHSGSCGLCSSIALIVSWSVSELCASYCRTNRSHSSKAWPLSPTHGNCSNCVSIARYRLLWVGSHSSRKRLQISNPLPGSISFVIIWSARSFVCIVSMNASCLARLFCSSLMPDKGNSRNGFASTSTSSTQSSSSTAEMYCRVLNDQPSHWSISPANVSGSFPTLRSTKCTLASWAEFTGVRVALSASIVVRCRISCSCWCSITARCWPTCVPSCCGLCANSSIQIPATFQSTHGDSLVP